MEEHRSASASHPALAIVGLGVLGALLVALGIGQSFVAGGRDLSAAARACEVLAGFVLIGIALGLRRQLAWAWSAALVASLLLAALLLLTSVWALFWPKADGHGMAYVAFGAVGWAALPIACAANLRAHRRGAH